MSTEENKAVTRRGIETLNQRNWAEHYELIAPDFVLHAASRTIQGIEAYKQFVSMYLTGLPDVHFTIEDMFGEGDRVAVRYTYRGTHKGDFMGIPPTGKQVAGTGIGIARVANGMFLEEWINSDLMQQLGVTPTPGQAS